VPAAAIMKVKRNTQAAEKHQRRQEIQSYQFYSSHLLLMYQGLQK